MSMFFVETWTGMNGRMKLVENEDSLLRNFFVNFYLGLVLSNSSISFSGSSFECLLPVVKENVTPWSLIKVVECEMHPPMQPNFENICDLFVSNLHTGLLVVPEYGCDLSYKESFHSLIENIMVLATFMNQ